MGSGAGSLLGGQVQPYTPNPTMGQGNQQSYLNTLFNSVVGPYKGGTGGGSTGGNSGGNSAPPTQLQQQITQLQKNLANAPAGSVQQQLLQQELGVLQSQQQALGSGPGGAAGGAAGGSAGSFMGLPGYTGQLSPTAAQTPLLGASQGSWNPGTGQPNQQIMQMMNNAQGLGGVGGVPTQAMNSILQNGGVGPGAQAMNNATMLGTPSAAGSPMLQMAQGKGAAIAQLAPFLQGIVPPTAQGQFFTPPNAKAGA